MRNWSNQTETVFFVKLINRDDKPTFQDAFQRVVLSSLAPLRLACDKATLLTMGGLVKGVLVLPSRNLLTQECKMQTQSGTEYSSIPTRPEAD